MSLQKIENTKTSRINHALTVDVQQTINYELTKFENFPFTYYDFKYNLVKVSTNVLNMRLNSFLFSLPIHILYKSSSKTICEIFLLLILLFIHVSLHIHMFLFVEID